MEIVLTEKANEDLRAWKNSGNLSIQQKISALLLSIRQTPFEGLGKPEPLKHQLKGVWSRRINKEHRLLYEVEDKCIVVLSLKGHY